MKLAMIIIGVSALVLDVIGCIPFVKAIKNEDVKGVQIAMRWFCVAALFLFVFFILLAILSVRALLSFLG